jgi:hypothetical protein
MYVQKNKFIEPFRVYLMVLIDYSHTAVVSIMERCDNLDLAAAMLPQ